MKVAERILLAMALTLGLSGCRAFNNGSLSSTTRPLGERTFDLDRFVAEHNQNAERIQSLTAKPSIGVAGRVMRASADGRLALERPRNFKLELSSMNDKKADIGSNDEEFWFWVQNDKDHSIYWCRYGDLDASSLAIDHQPDWIIEALGLRLITPAEAAQLKPRKGRETGTTELSFPPTRSAGETYTRMMVVWDKTRRIKEHRIYTGNGPKPQLLARADVKNFKEFETGGTIADEPNASKTTTTTTATADSPETCYLPENVRLEWTRDQLALDVLMHDVKVNQFDSARSAALFIEPSIPGYERVNLAELSRRQSRDGRTSVRQTLPPPGSRSGVRLGRPTPVPEDTSTLPSAGSNTTQTTTSVPKLEDLVTEPVPVSAETPAMRAAALAAAADVSPISP
jgi:hypothetical protein